MIIKKKEKKIIDFIIFKVFLTFKMLLFIRIILIFKIDLNNNDL